MAGIMIQSDVGGAGIYTVFPVDISTIDIIQASLVHEFSFISRKNQKENGQPYASLINIVEIGERMDNTRIRALWGRKK